MTSVVSRIGTASTSTGSSSVATVEPATVQLDASPSAASAKPSTWAPLSPMKTAAGPAEAEVVGQEADAGEADAEREQRDEVARMHRVRVDREERAGDRGERRREAVHVVEQVERVRHADQPGDADHRRDDGVADDLHAHARDEHERGGRALRAELRERRQMEEVVGEAGGEEDRAAAEDAAELAGRRNEAGCEGDPGRREQSREDAAPAEQRRRAGVPAVRARCRHDMAGCGGVQQAPDRQETRRQRGKGSHGDRHGRSVTKRCKKGVWGGRPAVPAR